jgi:hypothetical protein
MTDRPERASEFDQAGDQTPGSFAARYGRRALMLGAAATGAGVAASLVGGGLAEAAPDGSPPVLLGKSNTTSGATVVTSRSHTGIAGHAQTNNQAGATGLNTARGANSFGVFGHSVHGTGVNGISQHGNGIVGNASTVGFSGVAGIDSCLTKGAQGVYGQSTRGDGVLGVSFNGTGVTGTCRVVGTSGVFGLDQTPKAGSHGVIGQSPHGDGVFGNSPNGVGVHAESTHGIALKVQGKTKFSTSGVVSVASGQRTMTVSVPGLTTSDLVLATIQRPEGGVFIEAAQPGADAFTITLSKNPSSPMPIAWLVLSQ